MSAQKSAPQRIGLVSADPDLIATARSALAAQVGQDLIVLEKSLSELGSEARELAVQALLVDLDASRVEDFESLQKLRRMVGPSTAVIALTDNFSPAAARILIQLKVADFLMKPVKTADLVRACNNALKTPGEEHQVEPQFLAFMPATGGVGTTSIALEAAQILNKDGRRFGRTTCVVDLNFQQGTCAEYLDIEPAFDISEIENAPERLDRQLLELMLARHSSGLSVIAAPSHPSELRSFRAPLVMRVLDLVSAYFDYVVLDMPRFWMPWTETVILGSNRLFVVADMTVPSIRHSRRLIAAIDEKVGTQVDAKVIVNRYDRRATASGLSAKDVEAALGDSFAGGIPNNYRLVRDAVDRGVPLETVEPDNNVTQAVRQIIGAEAGAVDAAPRRGLLQRGLTLLRKAG